MSIYQQKLLLSQLLNHDFKSTIFLYKSKKFPKIVVFKKFLLKMLKKCNLLPKNSKRMFIYQQKLFEQFLENLFKNSIH